MLSTKKARTYSGSSSSRIYLDETAFRLNKCENRYLFRDTVLKLLEAQKLPFSELVADK